MCSSESFLPLSLFEVASPIFFFLSSENTTPVAFLFPFILSDISFLNSSDFGLPFLLPSDHLSLSSFGLDFPFCHSDCFSLVSSDIILFFIFFKASGVCLYPKVLPAILQLLNNILSKSYMSIHFCSVDIKFSGEHNSNKLKVNLSMPYFLTKFCK